MGHRLISTSKEVYRRLSKLSIEKSKLMNDLIKELLNNYKGKVRDSNESIIKSLNEIKAMFRDYLSKLTVKARQVVETELRQVRAKTGVGDDSEFEDNP